MTNKEHFKRGLDSGYLACCIAWCLARAHLVAKRWYKPSTKPKGPYSHVVCPICRIRHALARTEIFYSYCRDCNWTQFRRIKCNLCGELPYNPLERPRYAIDRSVKPAQMKLVAVER